MEWIVWKMGIIEWERIGKLLEKSNGEQYARNKVDLNT